MLGREAPLQRYEAGEHAQIGGAGTIMVNGVELTEGEINAMGDFFATSGALKQASSVELEALRNLIRRDRSARTGVAGFTPVETSEWEKATGNRYLKLAADNRAHFAPAPGSSGLTGENHKARWYELHRQSLHQAWFDGRFNGHQVSNEARVQNAFAAHFLTDAFSAGHLINKAAVIAFAAEQWDKMATTGWIFEETAFTKAVSEKVLADKVAGPKLKAHELKMISWERVTETRFSEFLWQVAKSDRGKFFNAFARIVHDHLDDAMKGPDTGVEVTNGRGEGPWRLSGDATLAKSPETLRIANAAALEANANLVVAAASISEPDYPTLCDRVWAYTPQPTKAGAAMVKDAIAKIGDAATPESVAAFSALTIAEVDAAIKELTDMGYLRVAPPAQPALPTPEEMGAY